MMEMRSALDSSAAAPEAGRGTRRPAKQCGVYSRALASPQEAGQRSAE